MSYNGSGTFNINTAGQPVVTGTTITSTAFNLLTADLATGLSTALTKDGQTTPTANIPLGGFKITGLGAGTAATDAAQYGQLQAGATTIATVTGTDTYVGTLSPAIAAYATGNLFSFVAPNTNTGAATINLNSLGAKNITKLGSTALAAGDIVSGRVYQIEYDGTRFQLLNPSASTVASFSAGSTGFTPSSATTGAVTLAGTLATTNGGTGLTSFTSGGVVYASSSSALATGSALTYDGSNFRVNSGTNWATSTGGVQLSMDGAGSDAYLTTYYDAHTLTLGAGVSLKNLIKISGSAAGNNILFNVNNSEQMRLTSTGLGIGTSSPASALYVKRTSGNSGIYTDYNGTNVGRIEAASNGNLYIGLTTGSGDLSIGNTANANAFILNSSGNLGLGVTPSAWNAYVALQIGNGFLANYAATADTYIGSNAYYQSGFKYTTSGQAASAIQIANGGFGFKIAPSGTAGNAITFTQAMTLDASGRLQIGTTNSASATIRGLGASNANAYYYLDANGPFGGSPSYSSILGFALYTDSGARYNSHAEIACVADSNYSGSLTFSTQNPGTYPNTVTERMRLASGGQLLIGTTTLSGTNRLVVATTTAIDAAMTVKAELANYASIINIEAQNDNGAIYNYIASNTTGVTQHWKISGGAATNTMAFSTAGSERARIDSSGNLLVGTTTAYAHFASKAVAGQAAGWFSVATNGDAGIFFANASNTTVGSVTVNSAGVLYNITSDYRLKNVIGAVTGHGERLDALEPIEYELKSDNSRTRGFLAHKFQEVYASSVSGSKDAVDANGNPVYQTMQASTSEVIADLVAEIQSLRKRLADAGI